MEEPKRFMRVPFFTVGYLVTNENMEDIAKWCQGHVIADTNTPFIRVPVERPNNKKQTEAYPGTWVMLSVRRGEKSYKVFTADWVRTQFFELPETWASDQSLEMLFGMNRTPSVDNRVADNVRSIPGQATPKSNVTNIHHRRP